MLENGVSRSLVEEACYRNALAIYGQSGQMNESDWLTSSQIDRTQLFEGNSVLRGQSDAPSDSRIIE